jgi:choline dehydrogenase-like flavoprotein
MLIDARRIPSGEVIETEVCILGAGPAGITAAQEFLGKDVRVCLLETGGTDYSEPIQQLASAEGDSVGDFYPGAYWMRHREFGGTAHRWNIALGNGKPGVRYVPFDPIDFEKRDEVPYSGWPITKADLDPYYERAQTVCQIGPYHYEVEDWADQQAQPFDFPSGNLYTKMFQCGPRDVFIQQYREQFRQSTNISTYLYATAVELETDDLGQTVTRVRVATLEGNQFHVAAKWVIVAKGGIESTRLLLLSNKVQQNGLGNQHGLVGRFFMDHQMVRAGLLKPSNPALFNKLALYDLRSVRGTDVIGKFLLTDEMMRRHRLLNTATAIFPRSSIYRWNPMRMLFPNGKNYRSKSVASVQALLKAKRERTLPTNLLSHLANIATGLDDILYLQLRRKPLFSHPSGMYGFDQGGWSALPDPQNRFGLFEVVQLAEQAPDPENRITLGTERDALGCPKVKLYWRWNDIDIQSTIRAQDILVEEFARAGLGQLKLERDRGVPQLILPSIHHHMGTTRMSLNPREGVVDADCKVHGISNLFIASSSVFPTGSYANPTLTIIAMAIRVADQVKTCMATSTVVV